MRKFLSSCIDLLARLGFVATPRKPLRARPQLRHPSLQSLEERTVLDGVVAIDDHFTVLHGLSTGGSVVGNDENTYGEVALVSGPGSTAGFLLTETGGFAYYAQNWVGTDSFSYVWRQDGVDISNVATVTIDIYNNAPTSTGQHHGYTHRGNDVTWGLYGISDPDPEDHFRYFTNVTAGPSHAAHFAFFSEPGSSGHFEYRSNFDFAGFDSFQYEVSDGVYTTGPYTFLIEVQNARPIAGGTTNYSVLHDRTLAVERPDLTTDHENDPIWAKVISDPSSAAIFDFDTLSASFTYKPQLNWIGQDQFIYVITDGLADSNPLTVNINVGNTPPYAGDDTFTTPHSTQLSVSAYEVASDDGDDDDDDVMRMETSGPSYGSILFNPDGSFTYLPVANWVGTDSFTYRVNDGVEDGQTATVTIVVDNDPPVGVNDAYVAITNTKRIVAANGVLANDGDAQGDSLTASLDSDVTHGTLTLNSDGSFEYRSDADFVGNDYFTYRPHDGVEYGQPVIVTIQVKRPRADIDVDSNNNGTIDPNNTTSGTDDTIEADTDKPGMFIRYNGNDDNGNDIPDREDDAGPFVDENDDPVDDPDLAIAQLAILNLDGLDLAGFTARLEISSGVRVWSTQDKQENLDGQTWSAASLPSQVLVEGYEHGASTISLVLKNADGDIVHEDVVRATAISVDLDIDSDNNNSLDDPDRTAEEDEIEDTNGDPDVPGKVIFANTGNFDGDGVPDFVDGINVFGNQGDDASSRFTPVLVQIQADSLTESSAKLTFTYNASPPANVTRVLGAGDKYIYSAAAGQAADMGPPMRLWTKDGDVSRNVASVTAGGDYLPHDQPIALSALPASAEVSPGLWRFYVEAIGISQETADQQIEVHFNPTGGSATAGVAKDAVRSTVIDWGIVEVHEDESWHPTDEIVVSDTAPMVEITEYTITNLRLSSDLTQILGDIQVEGTLDCAVCDFTPGSLGQINQVWVFLNGAYTALGGIVTVVSKADGLDSLLKPYDFSATFSGSFAGVALRPGFNNLQVTASDPIYESQGFAEWAVQVLVSQPSSTEIVELDLSFASAPSPAILDQIAVTIHKNGVPTTDILVETEPDSLFFENGDSSIALDLRSMPALDPNAVDSIAALLWDANTGIEGVGISVDESAINSLAFAGFAERDVEAHEFVDYGGFTLGVGDSQPVGQSAAGMLRAYLLQMRGPDEVLERIDYAITDDGPRKVVEASGGHFLGMKEVAAGGAAPVGPGDTLRPAVLTARLAKIAADAYVNPHTSLQYKVGVLEGFFKNGLVGLLEGAWDLLKLGYEIQNYYSPGEIIVRWQNGELFPKEKQLMGIAADTVKVMADVAQKVQQFEVTTIEAIITGNVPQLQDLGNTAILALEISVDVLLDFAERLSTLSEREKGRVVGQVLFEAITFIGPAAATKVTKLGFLNHIRTAAAAGRFGTNATPLIEAGFQAGARLFKLIDLFSDTTNKMCFVAGTKVHTDRGLKDIERIVVGDRVLSRDQNTGEQAYKRVTETFVTQPSRLYTILYRPLKAPSTTESKLVCSGEHPFYSVDRGEFVPADQLTAGVRLRLANGSEAVVTASLFEDAPKGQIFTTYNFTVDEFNTYFVGNAGVWVHNTGTWCEHFKGFWFWLKESQAQAPEQAARLTEKLIASGLSKKRFSTADYHEAVESMAKLAADEIGDGVGPLPTHRELLRALTRPAGVPDNTAFGTLMKWRVRDVRSAGAIKAMDDIDAVYLQNAGVTQEIARQWRDFYLAAIREGRGDRSSAGRAILMHHAYLLLGGT